MVTNKQALKLRRAPRIADDFVVAAGATVEVLSMRVSYGTRATFKATVRLAGCVVTTLKVSDLEKVMS
jgi:hypothetical protein